MWHFSKFTSHLCNHVTKGRCIVTVPPEDIAHCALLPRPESPRHCWSSLGPWRTRTRRRGAGTRGHGGNSQPIRGRRGLGWTNGRPGQGHVTRAGHGGTWRPIRGRGGRSIIYGAGEDGALWYRGGCRVSRAERSAAITYQSNQLWRKFWDLDLEI